MRDPEDILELGGRPLLPEPPRKQELAERLSRSAWKSVWFQCCHVYGRIYRNAQRTKYEGRCPRCGAAVHALIGESGTSRRIFGAQ